MSESKWVPLLDGLCGLKVTGVNCSQEYSSRERSTQTEWARHTSGLCTHVYTHSHTSDTPLLRRAVYLQLRPVHLSGRAIWPLPEADEGPTSFLQKGRDIFLPEGLQGGHLGASNHCL